MTRPLGASVLAIIVSAATLVACAGKTGPGSPPARGSATSTTTAQAAIGVGQAELAVDGHTHKISGLVNCTAQAATADATAPLGNLAISASDDTASFAMSWLSNTKSPVMGLTLSYKVGSGEYTMPYYPKPPNLEAKVQDNTYTVKGTPPVLTPGESTLKKLPVEIHVACP